MKIAIFNGFPFHFEMFGYIIHFCKKTNDDLIIYTPPPSHGWKEFYNTMYPKLQWKQPSEITSDCSTLDCIILTTDDDFSFPDALTSIKKVICIDHSSMVRRQNVDMKYHLGTRPFSINYRKWALPCYPIITTISEKRDALIKRGDYVNIAIIGGGGDHYTIEHINRLSSTSMIQLHFISRTVDPNIVLSLDNKFKVFIHENTSTDKMMQILKESKYVLCDITRKLVNITGNSMSGSVPLAFSNLNKLILSKDNNTLYKFKTAQTFDLNSSDPIEVTSSISLMELQNIINERNTLIKDFHNHMNKLL